MCLQSLTLYKSNRLQKSLAAKILYLYFIYLSLNAPMCTNRLSKKLVMAIMVYGKWTQELGPKLLDRDRGRSHLGPPRSILEPIFKASSG